MEKSEKAEHAVRWGHMAVAFAGGLEATTLSVAGDVHLVFGRSPASAVGMSPIDLLLRVTGRPRTELVDALTRSSVRYETVGVLYEARWLPGTVGGALVVVEAHVGTAPRSLAEWDHSSVPRELAILWAADVRGHVMAARREVQPLLLDHRVGAKVLLRLHLVVELLDRAGEAALEVLSGLHDPMVT